MKVLIMKLAAIGLALGIAAAPAAAQNNANGNKLICFDGTTGPFGYNGICTLSRDGATFNNPDIPPGSFAGVYLQNSNLGSRKLQSVNQLGFSYSGDGTTATAPKFRIPIDVTGDGGTDLIAWIPAPSCNDGVGNVDVIKDATCTVSMGSSSYPNWAAFVAGNPGAQHSDDYFSLIVADGPGVWVLSNIRLGKGPAKGTK